MHSSYLIHYASEYYDPAKASDYNRQYYEAHKQLKGRQSGRKLNEAGQVALYTVKTNIQNEKEQSINYSQGLRDEKIAEIQNEITNLKSLGKADREAKKEELTERIQALKDECLKEKERLTSNLDSQRSSTTARIEQRKERASAEIEKKNEEAKKKSEALKEEKERNTNSAKNRTDALRAQMKALPAKSKTRREQLQREIDAINAKKSEDNSKLDKESRSISEEKTIRMNGQAAQCIICRTDWADINI